MTALIEAIQMPGSGLNDSGVLTNLLTDIVRTGSMPGSGMNAYQFLNILDAIAVQFTAFNPSYIAAAYLRDYNGLDAMARHYFATIFKEVFGQDAILMLDGDHPNRMLIAPSATAFPKNATIIHQGTNSVLPIFQLKPGHTSADVIYFLTPDKKFKCDDEGKPPRSPNCFLIYRSERHQSVLDANPGATNTVISRILGNQWQNETPEVRALYKAKAVELKEAFDKKYPDYKYCPRKSADIKRRAKKAAQNVRDAREAKAAAAVAAASSA